MGQLFMFGNFEAVRQLLAFGAEAHGLTRSGQLYLTAAVQAAEPDLCAILLDSGCTLAADEADDRVSADHNGVFHASLVPPLAEAISREDVGVLDVLSMHPRIRLSAMQRAQVALFTSIKSLVKLSVTK
jgi:hypothetical protein